MTGSLWVGWGRDRRSKSKGVGITLTSSDWDMLGVARNSNDNKGPSVHLAAFNSTRLRIGKWASATAFSLPATQSRGPAGLLVRAGGSVWAAAHEPRQQIHATGAAIRVIRRLDFEIFENVAW